MRAFHLSGIKAALARRLGKDRGALLLFAGLAGALFLFIKLTSEVLEGESRAFDSVILEQVRAATGSSAAWALWLRSFMLDLTTLGNPNMLMLIAAIAVGYLLIEGRYRLAGVLAGSLATGALLEVALKHVFARARPDLVEHLVEVRTASFPSGHAMDSAMVYLTIAALLTRAVRDHWSRVYIFAVAVMLTTLIGISRVYLGVHWPTDILAGWIAGAIWAVLCSLAASRASPRAKDAAEGRS